MDIHNLNSTTASVIRYIKKFDATQVPKFSFRFEVECRPRVPSFEIGKRRNCCGLLNQIYGYLESHYRPQVPSCYHSDSASIVPDNPPKNQELAEFHNRPTLTL